MAGVTARDVLICVNEAGSVETAALKARKPLLPDAPARFAVDSKAATSPFPLSAGLRLSASSLVFVMRRSWPEELDLLGNSEVSKSTVNADAIAVRIPVLSIMR